VKRRIFNAIAVMSAVLCVAMLSLWAFDWHISWNLYFDTGPQLMREGQYRNGLDFFISWLYPLALALLAPCFWIIRAARDHAAKRRVASGHCIACGYDLRATPQGGAVSRMRHGAGEAEGAGGVDAGR
jgi:hypothetical protein